MITRDDITVDLSGESEAVRFFFEHAGFSYGNGETKEQGLLRCARELAAAEELANEAHWELELAPDGDTYGWEDECFDVVNPLTFRGDAYLGFDARLVDSKGHVLATLGGVTFANNDPSEPYARVIFAELADEALA